MYLHFYFAGLWYGNAVAITILGIAYFVILCNIDWEALSEEVSICLIIPQVDTGFVCESLIRTVLFDHI